LGGGGVAVVISAAVVGDFVYFVGGWRVGLVKVACGMREEDGRTVGSEAEDNDCEEELGDADG
jgi:hypothetical protein